MKPSTFEMKEAEFKEKMATPLNILMVESVKNEMVKSQAVMVRRPGGEEVLANSGIISWQEDLIH